MRIVSDVILNLVRRVFIGHHGNAIAQLYGGIKKLTLYSQLCVVLSLTINTFIHRDTDTHTQGPIEATDWTASGHLAIAI